MANEEEKKPKGQGFSFIKKLLMTQEFLDKENEGQDSGQITESPEAPKTQSVSISSGAPTKSFQPVASATMNRFAVGDPDVEDVVRKLHDMMEKLNMPGIDFFEVWNAALKTGGLTKESLEQAYGILKYVADSGFGKNSLVASANYYITEIQKVMKKEVDGKQIELTNLASQQKTDGESLTQEIDALNNDIRDWNQKILQAQQELAEKEEELKKLDQKYTEPINAIQKKIEIGNLATKRVVEEINNAVAIIKQIKE